jgi:hypothetical protein
MRFRAFLVLVAALVLLASGSALAAPPVILTVGQVSQHPTATWSLPPGGQSSFIEVATAPTVGSDGYFFLENVVAAGVPQPTDTSWTSTYQLDPGTYYVHVAGDDTACGACPFQEFSTIVTLVIPSPPPPPPPPPLPPPPPPVTATPPVISSATGDGKGLMTITWSLPAGVTSSAIQISSDPTVDSVGFFSTTSQLDFSVLSGTQTSYTTSYAQLPGTYYVHVAGTQPSYGALFVWSAPSTITVPARTVAAKVAAAKAPTKAKASNSGNKSAVVRSRTKTYVASTKTLVRLLSACSSLACGARQVTAFAVKQLSYELFVDKDAKRAAPCGSAARGLRFRLRKSETATTALHRGILNGTRGTKLQSLARMTGLQAGRAITASHLYVAACS